MPLLLPPAPSDNEYQPYLANIPAWWLAEVWPYVSLKTEPLSRFQQVKTFISLGIDDIILLFASIGEFFLSGKGTTSTGPG